MEMFQANNEFLQSRGHEPGTRLYAHGQGYDLVERPSFQVGETMKIHARMNIAVHPTAPSKLATGKVCDNYMITETGTSECLHRFPKEITVL